MGGKGAKDLEENKEKMNANWRRCVMLMGACLRVYSFPALKFC